MVNLLVVVAILSVTFIIGMLVGGLLVATRSDRPAAKPAHIDRSEDSNPARSINAKP